MIFFKLKEGLPFLFINVVLMVGLSLAAFYYYMNVSIEKGRTRVFIIMAFTQLFNVFNLRNIRKSVFKIGLFSNKYINLAVSISIILLILVTEVPTRATLFHFESLYIVDLIILFAFSSSVLWACELYKFLNKKKWLSSYLDYQDRARYVNSDMIRNQLFVVKEYSQEEKKKVYCEMVREMKKAIQQNASCVFRCYILE